LTSSATPSGLLEPPPSGAGLTPRAGGTRAHGIAAGMPPLLVLSAGPLTAPLHTPAARIPHRAEVRPTKTLHSCQNPVAAGAAQARRRVSLTHRVH
jgi:hypothetical protein